MRKILPLIIVGILVLSGLGAVGIPSNEDFKYKNISVSFSNPTIKTENEYVSLNFDEANAYFMDDGKPMLPSYVHTFSFPFGTKINKVTCTLSNFQEKTLTNVIEPTPKCALTSQKIVNKVFEQEQIDYGVDPYPSNHLNYNVRCGRNRDGLNIFVNVEVIPVKYYPMENKIEWARDAEIFIEYEPSNEQPATFDDEYKFIVIAPIEFTDELAPFVEHKIGRNISTKFLTLNEIYNGNYFPVEGRDDQEQIKYFIKNAIENWGSEYVLLVGGEFKFPIRESHLYIAGNNEEMIFVSDLYYADIYNQTSEFCSWDSNNNDVFAEFDWGETNNFDEVDLFPDIYLGRLACVNSVEVTTCVNKIINYENSGAYSQEWFKDMVVIGGDTWVPDSGDTSGVPEGEYIIEHVIELMNGFDFNEIYATNNRLGTWIPPYGVGDITSSINKGCGFLHWSGHGNLDVWATHRHEGSENNWIPTLPGHYTNTDVKNLNNGDELPITVIGACLVGKFNWDADCFTWSFLLNSEGGAIAATSATEGLYSTYGKACTARTAGLIEISMFKSYAEEHASTFGEMWAWALQLYIEKRNMKLRRTYRYDYATVEEWQPFGDPTLAIGPESQPPEKPNPPHGQTNGYPNIEYIYYASTTDPDEDQISYLFDWGDGSFSDWSPLVDSGTEVSASHTWTTEATFNVKVQARDKRGDLSEWSDPLKVIIPRTKIAENNIFLGLFDRFIELFPILKIALQLVL